MYHTELNGEGHVFTHVGLHSQHEGPHKWQVPEQYLYLSDDKEDERLCNAASWIPVAQAEETVVMSSDSVKIDWGKYFDKVYWTFLLRESNPRLPRLLKELKRVDLLDSPVFECGASRGDVSFTAFGQLHRDAERNEPVLPCSHLYCLGCAKIDPVSGFYLSYFFKLFISAVSGNDISAFNYMIFC